MPPNPSALGFKDEVHRETTCKRSVSEAPSASGLHSVSKEGRWSDNLVIDFVTYTPTGLIFYCLLIRGFFITLKVLRTYEQHWKKNYLESLKKWPLLTYSCISSKYFICVCIDRHINKDR